MGRAATLRLANAREKVDLAEVLFNPVNLPDGIILFDEPIGL